IRCVRSPFDPARVPAALPGETATLGRLPPVTSRAVLLVEGRSDEIAVRTLARRRGRDLAAEGVSVLAVGGAQAMGRFLATYGPRGAGDIVAGVSDQCHETYMRTHH